MTREEVDDAVIATLKSFPVGGRSYNPEVYRAIFVAGMRAAAKVCDGVRDKNPSDEPPASFLTRGYDLASEHCAATIRAAADRIK